MAAGNNVTVVGNATREAELRSTPSGYSVCNFGLAVNRRWQNKSTDEWEEEVSFFDVECWGDLAENVSESAEKGMRLIVAGRFDQRSWEDKETGDTRYKFVLVADEVGPSLRWATAEVEKTSKDDKPAKGKAKNKPAKRAAAADYDEEPF